MKMLRLAAVSALLSVVSVPVAAEILALPSGGYGVTQSASSAPRGASQIEVLNLFGEPQRRHRPVGEPAISSWEYAEFRVYFENGLVLHTVRNRSE
ncbi:MAG: hypothetical protein AAF404_06055 [Pseudomonadota bacterium]